MIPSFNNLKSGDFLLYDGGCQTDVHCCKAFCRLWKSNPTGNNGSGWDFVSKYSEFLILRENFHLNTSAGATFFVLHKDKIIEIVSSAREDNFQKHFKVL